MRSPTNLILTGLAVADLVLMVDFVPFIVHDNIQNLLEHERLTWFWSMEVLIHAHISIVFHTISSWLTILLAVWRYLAVSFSTQTKLLLTLQNSVFCIIAVYIIVLIVCIPFYLSFSVVEEEKEINSINYTLYRVDWSELANENGELLKHLNIWVFGVGSKLVPCILLTYLSFALKNVFHEANKRKKRLQANNFIKKSTINQANKLINECSFLSTETTLTDSTSKHPQAAFEVKKNLLNPSYFNKTKSNCLLHSSQTNDLLKYSNSFLNLNTYLKKQNTEYKLDLDSKSNSTNDMQIVTNLNSNSTLHLNENPMLCISEHASKNNLLCNPTFCHQSVLIVKNNSEIKLNPSKHVNIREPSSEVVTTTFSSEKSPNTYLQSQTGNQGDRTTKMLLSILFLFLITEFPSGIIILLSSILGQEFFKNVYNPLGELLDMLSLLNSAVNFILYCSMSRQFRSTFAVVVLRRKMADEKDKISTSLLSQQKQHPKSNLINKKTKKFFKKKF